MIQPELSLQSKFFMGGLISFFRNGINIFFKVRPGGLCESDGSHDSLRNNLSRTDYSDYKP